MHRLNLKSGLLLLAIFALYSLAHGQSGISIKGAKEEPKAVKPEIIAFENQWMKDHPQGTFAELLQAEADYKINQAIPARSTTPCKTLSACRRDAASFQAQIDATNTELEKLSKANEEMESNFSALKKHDEELAKAATEVLSYNQRLEAEYKKLNVAYSQLVDKHNALIREASAVVNQYNADVRRNVQLQNQLLIKQLFTREPDWTDAVLNRPRPSYNFQPYQSNNINCSSDRVGQTTYTHCY